MEFADAELAALIAQGRLTFAELDVASIRAGVEERTRSRARGPELAEVRDIGRFRLYRPAAGPLPLVLYLHGGGWTIGSLDSFDRVCRRLAAGSGCAVAALDYRLAPEHPWPVAVDDTVDALRRIASRPPELGEQTGRVAVVGDSAGGTLAALACLRLRTAPELLPDLQVLIYANTDLADEDSPSMRDKATGYGLEAETSFFFSTQWVPDRSRWADPTVSPLRARDVSGVPAAIVVTAEHDPLRDEGEAYAERLRDARVDVVGRREAGLVHNFLQLDDVSPACAAAADRLAAEIGNRLR